MGKIRFWKENIEELEEREARRSQHWSGKEESFTGWRKEKRGRENEITTFFLFFDSDKYDFGSKYQENFFDHPSPKPSFTLTVCISPYLPNLHDLLQPLIIRPQGAHPPPRSSIHSYT